MANPPVATDNVKKKWHDLKDYQTKKRDAEHRGDKLVQTDVSWTSTSGSLSNRAHSDSCDFYSVFFQETIILCKMIVKNIIDEKLTILVQTIQ